MCEWKQIKYSQNTVMYCNKDAWTFDRIHAERLACIQQQYLHLAQRTIPWHGHLSSGLTRDLFISGKSGIGRLLLGKIWDGTRGSKRAPDKDYLYRQILKIKWVSRCASSKLPEECISFTLESPCSSLGVHAHRHGDTSQCGRRCLVTRKPAGRAGAAMCEVPFLDFRQASTTEKPWATRWLQELGFP
jgi:hypothetical protein